MPVPLLEAYLREVPRLEAAADLRASTAVGVGMAGKEGAKVRREWERIANGDRARKPNGRPSGVSDKASLATMAAMGITIASKE